MLYSAYPISLCVLLLIKSSSPSRHSPARNKFYPVLDAKSRQGIDNLRQTLNFIHRSPDFRPLTFSVILPEFRSGLVDVLLQHIRENTIEAYKLRARDLSSPRASWMNRMRLTWVLFVRDLANLYIFIYWQRDLWRASDQYLIVFTDEVLELSWRDVFGSLWRKYSVYRAIVIAADDNFRCPMRYMPFERFEQGFGGVHRLCSREGSGEGAKRFRISYDSSRNENPRLEEIEEAGGSNAKLFEDFQNLNRYPVSVTVFESLLMNVSYDEKGRLTLEKPDAMVMFTLERAMKARFLVRATKKVDFEGDPFAASLTSIESGQVEMVITGFFVKVYRPFQGFQFTCAVYEDRVCFLSPDSGLVPKAYMPFLPFQRSLWVLLIAYNVVMTLLWCLVKRISDSWRHNHLVDLQLPITNRSTNRLQTGRRSNDPSHRLGPGTGKNDRLKAGVQSSKPGCYDSRNRREPQEIPSRLAKFIVFIEHLCYPFQRGETPTQKALLFGTLFFGLIVNGLYQSYLVSSLSKPLHHPQLHTLEDVLNSGKMIVTRYENLRNVFVDKSLWGRRLGERIEVISSQKSTKDFVAYQDKIAITRYYTIVLEDFMYYDREGNSLIHVVDECPKSYRVSYVLRSRSPYAERVDFLLLRLREAGLLDFWFESMLYPIKAAKMSRSMKREKRMTKLTLDHYSLTFSLLFVGLIVATAMFLGEVYVAKRGTSKRLTLSQFNTAEIRANHHQLQ